MAQTQQYRIIQPAEVATGMVIRIHQKIVEGSSKDAKERIQVYEGLVLNVRGKSPNRTMTVRKVSNGVGVEKIFPLHLPSIEKIEAVKQYKTRRKNIAAVVASKKRLKEVPIKPARMKPAPAIPQESERLSASEEASDGPTVSIAEAPAESAPVEKTEQESSENGTEEKQPA
ncbi:50S ribosomal protein L19 [Patescibacteria group bacterium]|uniref:50S ribosomal protein L19 n=1 Tax=candidate division WWE3 bacterium TaxID=2053526 RepID=A0A928Y5G6_UNCKA|nr:50S ribosomal protein L19 [candidate division WWE3 bacterium]MCL4732708.1 50S ribosomal protein L19 [Patescibacteria group bacterium]MDL1952970.1 50S ribosomal protein L19 [Candidatus Uhrbacteria bacterium UHB]RIL00686.1 MAG: hypothetical protein DCC77_04050 [Candidatus Uhrbacteria bacterium]